MTLAPPTEEQARVIDHLKNTRHHTFITGKAGTGKSFVLKHFQASGKKKILVSAATGVAALAVDGKTLHRMLGLGTSLPADLYTDHQKIRYTHTWITEYDVLVIDEISMVSSELMDAIDRVLREIRHDESPFGGMQIVMFGDPYQLPPVVTDDFKKYLMRRRYKSEWFFDAKVWEQAKFDTFSLETIQRQRGDAVFTDLLNAVRDGSVQPDQLRMLNIVGGMNEPSEDSLLLAAYNRTVFERNTLNLAHLPGQTYTYEAKVNKGFGRDEPAERIIHLKPGAKILMLTNDRDDRWVNGTPATVITCAETWIQVETRPDKDDSDYTERHTVSPYSWVPSDTDPEMYAMAPKYTQMPVKLAWGVSVHKSQGMSLPEIEIDMGTGAFSAGQTYVALSRVTSAGGLHFRHPLSMGDIKVDPNVRRFFSQVGR